MKSKSKTLAVWLTFFGGPLGIHRWYLQGRGDWLAWLLPVPTLLGAYGVYRAKTLGVDDTLSWWLIPMLGFVWAACALTALVYGLKDTAQWNAAFNPSAAPEDAAGATSWPTVFGLVTALALGATLLMATLAYCIQHYFETRPEAMQTSWVNLHTAINTAAG